MAQVWAYVVKLSLGSWLVVSPVPYEVKDPNPESAHYGTATKAQ